MESKALVVKKKNYGYWILGIIFIFSILFSVVYFSSIEKNHKENVQEENGEIISYSGEKEGEIIFSYKDLVVPVVSKKIEDDKIENDKIQDDKIQDEEEKKETIQEEKKVFSSNRTIDSSKPMVALTFDDGPDPKRTQKIIDVLNKYHARASFFDIGYLMEKYPETLKAEVNSGADVGGHTYSHVNLNDLSKEEIQEEVSKLENVFQTITGKNLKYIRPTYGNANEMVRKTVKHPLINWCVDSLDWKTRDTDKILEEIYKTEDFDGKIIIMHVIYDATVSAVEKLVPDLIRKGYQLVTISEMAEAKGYTLENGKVYYSF